MASLIQQKMHQIADLFRGTQERKLPANSVIHNSKTLQAPADEDVSFDYAYKSTYLSGMMGNADVFVSGSSLKYDFRTRREDFRALAVQDEVENVLDIVCDDAIQNMTNGRPPINICPGFLTEKQEKQAAEHLDYILDLYSKYTIGLWSLFRKWLVDGVIALEIVSNDDGDVIGFHELDAANLTKSVPSNKYKDKYPFTWKYQQPTMETIDPLIARYTRPQIVELTPDEVLVLVYSEDNNTQRLSYVDRLQRSFNIMRTMEASRVIWAVTNSSYKMQFTVPVGNVNSPRSMQKLAESCAKYREVVDFNWENGRCKVNGNPMLPFYKEYWFASDGQNKIEMESVKHDGPDLNDIDTIDYFRKNFIRATHVPFSRFDRQGAPSIFSPQSEVLKEEVQYSNFISRLRGVFERMLVTPIIRMMAADDPEVDIAELGMKIHLQWSDRYLYNSEVGEAMRINNILGAVNDITQYQDSEGNAYFHPEFIARRFLGMTSADIAMNEKFKKKAGDADVQGEGGGDAGGDAGGGAGSVDTSDMKL